MRTQLFGNGVSFAATGMNRAMMLRSNSSTRESLAAAVGGVEKLKELEREATAIAEFEVLRGPHESQVQELRDKYGYAPEISRSGCP